MKQEEKRKWWPFIILCVPNLELGVIRLLRNLRETAKNDLFLLNLGNIQKYSMDLFRMYKFVSLKYKHKIIDQFF